MKTENFSLASATASQFFRVLTRVIRYDEGTGTGTPKIRVRSLSSGELDVEMQPGRQIRLPFAIDGIVIENLTASPITGKITIGAGDVSDNSLVGTVTLDAASLAALESVDLNAASIAQLLGIQPNNSYAVNTGGAASTAYTLVTPAANTNGLWVTEAQLFGYSAAGAHAIALIAKNSAPVSTQDGDVLLHAGGLTSQQFAAQLNQPAYVAAGKGLYFFNAQTDSGHAGLLRAARWKLL